MEWQRRNNFIHKYTGENNVCLYVCVCAVGELTGLHKQVAPSLPRGAALMMRRGGAVGVWRGEWRDALQQHLFLLVGKNKSTQSGRYEYWHDSLHLLWLNWTVRRLLSFPWLDDGQRQRQRELWGYSLGDHSMQWDCSGKLTPDREGEQC